MSVISDIDFFSIGQLALLGFDSSELVLSGIYLSLGLSEWQESGIEGVKHAPGRVS